MGCNLSRRNCLCLDSYAFIFIDSSIHNLISAFTHKNLNQPWLTGRYFKLLLQYFRVLTQVLTETPPRISRYKKLTTSFARFLFRNSISKIAIIWAQMLARSSTKNSMFAKLVACSHKILS